jgi:hypothetical protein
MPLVVDEPLLTADDEFGLWKSPSAQGSEGQQVLKQIEDVWRHWQARPSTLGANKSGSDEPAYEPMPPKNSFQVKVQYARGERGVPLLYDLDD